MTRIQRMWIRIVVSLLVWQLAVFYPQSGYLLVFTQQEMRATGLDTMHGFLIFKLTKCGQLRSPNGRLSEQLMHYQKFPRAFE